MIKEKKKQKRKKERKREEKNVSLLLSRPGFIEEKPFRLQINISAALILMVFLIHTFLPSVIPDHSFSMSTQGLALFLLLLFAYRSDFEAVESRTSLPYILLSCIIAAGVLVRNAVGATPSPQLGSVELFLFSVLTVMSVYGKNALKFAVPLTVSGSLVLINWLTSPHPHSLAPYIIPPVTTVSLGIAMLLIDPLNAPIVPIGPNLVSIRPPGGREVIAVINYQCSGIVSVLTYTIVVSALLVKEKLEVWKKVIVIGLGAVLTIYVNGLRIAILFLVAYYYNMDVMVLFHKNLGGFLFLVFIMVYWWVIFKFVITGNNPEREEAKETARDLKKANRT